LRRMPCVMLRASWCVYHVSGITRRMMCAAYHVTCSGCCVLCVVCCVACYV